MVAVKLRPAESSDIPAISQLAKKVWNQHYPAIIGQQQVDYMLALMYSDKSLQEQLNVKKHNFYFIETDKGDLGFISVNKEKDGSWFINKFYIDQENSGKGLGTEAFSALLKIIQAQEIRLTVNRQNHKAINFYFKCGFVIEKVADFDIGNGYVMNDFVMVWKKR